MRNTDLNGILFPVGMRSVNYTDDDGRIVPVERYRAVVDLETGDTMGMVGAGYRLVTNEEAIGFARDCARQLFGVESAADLEVFNIYSSRRRCYCHVDLIHRGYEVNVLKGEVYLPFVRMTNSYNTTRALRFDIGYCRKLCLNGVIFESEAIEFRYTHSHAEIGPALLFEIAKGKLDALWRSFETDAWRLLAYHVPEDAAVPLFFSALRMPLPPQNDETPYRRERNYAELRDDVSLRSRKYASRLGPNAYALFNAVTDFASNPPDAGNLRRTPHSMQTAAGTWAREFAAKVAADPDFGLEEYLGDYAKVASWSPQHKV